MNFDRLRFVAERAELGEGREALLSVDIPERPGTFFALHSHIHPRAVTEFIYRYNVVGERAHVLMSFKLQTSERQTEVQDILNAMEKTDMKAYDISDDEFAKSHVRYMIGGRQEVPNERVLRFGTTSFCSSRIGTITQRGSSAEFPERPGALRKFLEGLQQGWNISLFHYRNHGGGSFCSHRPLLVEMTLPQIYHEFLPASRFLKPIRMHSRRTSTSSTTLTWRRRRIRYTGDFCDYKIV
jgi:threonine dehydratase